MDLSATLYAFLSSSLGSKRKKFTLTCKFEISMNSIEIVKYRIHLVLMFKIPSLLNS